MDPNSENNTYTPPPPVESPQPNRPRLHPFPSHITSPFADYYTDIKWGNGFENWNLVRFKTPADNHCLFHAIANSFSIPYHRQSLDGKAVTRSEIVKNLRKHLSQRLSEPDPNDDSNRTYYETLNYGKTAEFGLPEFELNYMKKELDSDSFIGYGYLEYIGNVLNKDIYILEGYRADVYLFQSQEISLNIKGNRNSIVLYYIEPRGKNSQGKVVFTSPPHYELVGIHNPDGSFTTHFDPSHGFIRFLYNRLQDYIYQYC